MATARQVEVAVGLWRGQAQRWQGEAARLAADNLRLRARVGELEARVDALTEQVAALARVAFGPSSEKQAVAVGAPVAAGAAGDPGGRGHQGGQRRGRGQQSGSRGHGRRDYSGLPTVEVVEEVAEAERVCPRCGRGYAPNGEERTELIDWQVQLRRVVVCRPRLRRVCTCPVTAELVAPPPARPIPKGRFTAGFVARLLVEKHVLGRPLHRVGMALSHDGLQVAQGTLVGVLNKVSGLLWPLEQRIWARNRTAGHLHVDETGWRVFAPLAGKTSNRWWCWVFVGPDTTCFRIEPSRSTQVLADHLGVDLSAGVLAQDRRLLVSSDFFTVYQALGQVGGAEPLWCWAHMRRYFVHAGDVHPELSGWARSWVQRIGVLYAAHAAVAATAPDTAHREDAVAAMGTALGDIDAARRAQAADPTLPAPAARVLATLDREWEGLARHLDHPGLPLDNNTAERALRGPVVGRKNYYGAGSPASARLAARVWTITATCQRAGANPQAYLQAYLQACAAAGGHPLQGQALEGFLPWQASPADLAAWHNSDGPAP